MPTFMTLGGLNELPTLPSQFEMDQSYGDNLEQMYTDHNSLIGQILWQEDVLITHHQQAIEAEQSLRQGEEQLIS